MPQEIADSLQSLTCSAKSGLYMVSGTVIMSGTGVFSTYLPRSRLTQFGISSHHCTNKLHRLRQVTGFACGKGKTFKKPPHLTENNVKDVRSAQVPAYRPFAENEPVISSFCCSPLKDPWPTHILSKRLPASPTLHPIPDEISSPGFVAPINYPPLCTLFAAFCLRE